MRRPTKLIFLSITISFVSSILGRQYAVQFLDQLQKFLPILFHRDFGAKLLNAFILRLVHKGEAEVLQYSL